MSDKTKISIVADSKLVEQIRQRQERLSEQLGAKVSLNQVATGLLRQGLQDLARHGFGQPHGVIPAKDAHQLVVWLQALGLRDMNAATP